MNLVAFSELGVIGVTYSDRKRKKSGVPELLILLIVPPYATYFGRCVTNSFTDDTPVIEQIRDCRCLVGHDDNIPSSFSFP